MIWTSQRKSPRYHIAVPVRIQGQDSGGGAIDCEAWTLDVSAEGACITVPEKLEVPQRIRIVAEDYQFRADAEVDVVWERAFPQRAIGVRLVATTRRNVWQAR
jgi:hypothetical protein